MAGPAFIALQVAAISVIVVVCYSYIVYEYEEEKEEQESQKMHCHGGGMSSQSNKPKTHEFEFELEELASKQKKEGVDAGEEERAKFSLEPSINKNVTETEMGYDNNSSSDFTTISSIDLTQGFNRSIKLPLKARMSRIATEMGYERTTSKSLHSNLAELEEEINGSKDMSKYPGASIRTRMKALEDTLEEMKECMIPKIMADIEYKCTSQSLWGKVSELEHVIKGVDVINSKKSGATRSRSTISLLNRMRTLLNTIEEVQKDIVEIANVVGYEFSSEYNLQKKIDMIEEEVYGDIQFGSIIHRATKLKDDCL